ncbi:glycosyltransferase [Halorussus ruber]|uniref:glycosyltransferase n=1 Tax=Halorussus ruber TaxID=1126238 RepID=UPI001091B0D2|nr:glycosyltransferase [Halorussus ruber]
MNLLHVSKFYYPNTGGIEWVVKQLAEGTADGNAVNVLSSVPRGFGGDDVINGVRVTKAGSLGVALSVPLAPTFPFHLRSAIQEADVAHFHLPDPLSVISYLSSRDTATKTVATFHNDIVKQSTALQVYRPFLDRFLETVNRIIVTSPALLEQSEFLTPYREKCTIVPLGIDVDEFGDYSGTEFDLPGRDRPTILFAGRLIYYKGIEYLIDAMVDVDADLLIAGSGELREELEQRAADRGVDNKVTFLGYVSDEKLHYCYERADVFALPSIAPSEGFGIVQLEAMAYQTPIVNTNIPSGVPWVSKDGETGLTVPPRDSRCLSKALRTLVEDEQLRSTLGDNARRRVEAKFTHDRMVSKTNEVYEELLAE